MSAQKYEHMIIRRVFIKVKDNLLEVSKLENKNGNAQECQTNVHGFKFPFYFFTDA